MIATHELTKRYGMHRALDRCSLTASSGEVVGLLGPNGAGKTTLVRLLLGFLRPTSGRGTIGGWDCEHQSVRARAEVAYLPGNVRLAGRMRVADTLRWLCGLRQPDRTDQALALAERLELPMTRRVAYLSTGMRQKVAMCAVLSAEVPVLILDEPTANLDPSVRREVLALVTLARQAGRTIMFSSHVLSEIEEVCDRVYLLRDGRIVHEQDVSALRRSHRIRVRTPAQGLKPPMALQDLLQLDNESDGYTTWTVSGPLSPVLQWLAAEPRDELAIEPVGLRAVYEQYFPHPLP